MESLEQQIQPFIQPLISRIEALEAQNKLLKTTIDQLKAPKTQPKPNLAQNRLNRTQTQAQFNKQVPPKTIPPKVVPPVEPKQPAVIKKTPKPVTTQNASTTAVQDKNTTAEKSRTTLKTTDKQVKEPATERKETNVKDPKNVTSPKAPVKGKQPVGGVTIPAVKKDPKEVKQPIKSAADPKNPKVINGGKLATQQPKTETVPAQVLVEKEAAPVAEAKVEAEVQPKVEKQKVQEPIAPMIESIEVPQPQEPQTVEQPKIPEEPVVNVESEVKKDELLAQESATKIAEEEQKQEAPEQSPPVETTEESSEPVAAKIESDPNLPELPSQGQIL